MRATRKKRLIAYHRLLAEVSEESLQARREWDPIVQVPKNKETANQELYTLQSHPLEMMEK